jgi:ubiquinone/menaquinone biosynthesis C-methylase UbiE
MATELEITTRDLYNLNAKEWLNKSGGKDRPCFWETEMKQLVASFSTRNNLVLEVGCGPATDGRYLESKGVNCISTDYSIGMLNLAKEIGVTHSLIQMDMSEMSFANNTFDGFWATACLLHLKDPNNCLSELLRTTKKDGVGFISIKEGVGELVHLKTGYYFHYYQNSEFSTILHNNHFEIVQSDKRPGETNHDWLTYIVRANK